MINNKRTNSLTLSLAAVGVIALASIFTACGAVGKVAKQFGLNPLSTVPVLATNPPTVVAAHVETQVVPVPLAPVITVVTQRDMQVVMVTNPVTFVYLTNLVQVPSYLTNTVYTNAYAPDPASQRTGATIQAGSVLAGPYAPIVAGIGAVFTALSGIAAGYKTRQLKLSQDAHADTLAQLGNVIQAGTDTFEELRKNALQIPQYAAIDSKVMDKVTDIQRDLGVKTLFHDAVEKYTKNTSDAITAPATAPVAATA